MKVVTCVVLQSSDYRSVRLLNAHLIFFVLQHIDLRPILLEVITVLPEEVSPSLQSRQISYGFPCDIRYELNFDICT